MEFIGIDADYWAILLMEISNVERVLSIIREDVVVILIPVCQGREFGSGEL